jgi:ribosomal protein S18 acetylase RimI-like enzyme
MISIKPVKRMIKACLDAVQGVSWYRAMARLARRRIRIAEADPEEARKILLRFGSRPSGFSSRGPGVTIFVAKDGKRTVGYVFLDRLSESNGFTGYWLCGLTVGIFYRRMGIGEGLTRAVMKKAKENDAGELLLIVSEANLPAVRLYRKEGFQKKVIPAIEAQLKAEQAQAGFRRIVMSVVT